VATKNELKLDIEARPEMGATSARRLRAAGKIPGVLYGHGDAPEHVAFDARAFDDVIHHGGRNGIITLVIGKKTDAHAAAVVGDTVGDPFKDTAGPSLHVLVKLLATITLVLAPLFIR